MRDLSLHLMDIVQNSISAKANKIDIVIYADKELDLMEFIVTDNGVGMEDSFLKNVTDPFTTTRLTRKVGLGIPLLEASAKRSCGGLIVSSKRFEGTSVKATFKISHIDRLPLGDVTETIIGLIVACSDIEYEMELRNSKDFFKFSTITIKNKLGDVPIIHFEVIKWIREYVNEGIKIIFGGVLDEISS